MKTAYFPIISKAVLTGLAAMAGSVIGMNFWVSKMDLKPSDAERAIYISIVFCGSGAALGSALTTVLTAGSPKRTLKQLQQTPGISLEDRATLINLEEKL